MIILGGGEEMARDFKTRVFPEKEVRLLTTTPDGKKRLFGRPSIFVAAAWSLVLLAQGDVLAEAKKAVDTAEWDRDSATIELLLRRRECASAWELLSKHLRNGNRQAFEIAGAAIATIHGPGLRLPGAPTDGLSVLRLAAIFGVFASDGVDAPKAEHLIRSFGPMLGRMKPVCGDSFDAVACDRFVRGKHMVPTQEDFLKELDGYQVNSRSSGAFCIAPP